MRAHITVSLALTAAVLVMAPTGAEAYIGPGAGITVIGTVLALAGAVLLALVGFVWYPIKRLRARNKKRRDDSAPDLPR